MKKPLNIYFAAPLFSEADRDYNLKVYNRIRSVFGDKVQIYLPQLNDAINDKSAYADSIMIALADYGYIKNSDILIALTDGAQTDVGVGIEVGLAYERKLPILGLYTDVRQQGADNAQKVAALQEIGEVQFHYTNLMLNGLIKDNGALVNNIDDLITEIEKILNNKVVYRK